MFACEGIEARVRRLGLRRRKRLSQFRQVLLNGSQKFFHRLVLTQHLLEGARSQSNFDGIELMEMPGR